jgi:hypothetical protein
LVLENIASNVSTYSQRGDAIFAIMLLISFDFTIILHVMKNVMGIIDILYQTLL